ncbi:MAG: hypothetical protein GY739_05965 [Mesoflavibacter sp.]|nr:hypothetical protein [Mesoflavibacter sp.]
MELTFLTNKVKQITNECMYKKQIIDILLGKINAMKSQRLSLWILLIIYLSIFSVLLPVLSDYRSILFYVAILISAVIYLIVNEIIRRVHHNNLIIEYFDHYSEQDIKSLSIEDQTYLRFKKRLFVEEIEKELAEKIIDWLNLEIKNSNWDFLKPFRIGFSGLLFPLSYLLIANTVIQNPRWLFIITFASMILLPLSIFIETIVNSKINKKKYSVYLLKKYIKDV